MRPDGLCNNKWFSLSLAHSPACIMLRWPVLKYRTRQPPVQSEIMTDRFTLWGIICGTLLELYHWLYLDLNIFVGFFAWGRVIFQYRENENSWAGVKMSTINVPDVALRLEPEHINHQVQLGISTFKVQGIPHTDFQSTQGPQS